MTLFDRSHRPLLMGILNVTPDSFSGDGLMAQKDYVKASLDLAAEMIEDGAALLDIGGESSRPGAKPVPLEEELRRTVPVIAAIRKEYPALPISIDTIKASVAEKALDAGASLVNDISALKGDPAMGALVAKSGVPVILMHNRSEASNILSDAKVGGEYKAPLYENIIEDVKRDLAARMRAAKESGIGGDKIIIDPGIGFGKTVEQNLALINHVDQLKELGCPVLIGPSRKSFIGRALNLTVDDRLEGTAACVAIATLRGADIIRVHDVKFMARVARMTEALTRP